MKSSTAHAFLLLFTCTLLLAPSYARTLAEIQQKCDSADCGVGGSSYCFGFLTANAKSHNGGRVDLDSDPKADACFNKPSPDACSGKPWVAVERPSEGTYKFALIGKDSVGMILFKGRDAPAATLAVQCESSKVKIWVAKDSGSVLDWSAKPEEKPASMSGGICEFDLDKQQGGVDLSQEPFKVAFFEGTTTPPRDVTSSDTALNFLVQMKAAGDGDKAAGGKGGAGTGSFLKIQGGIIALLVATTFFIRIGH